MNVPLLLGGVAIIGISLYVRQAKAKNILEENEEIVPEAEPTYLTPPSGFRRAKQAEVTPNMSTQAKASLSSPMGSLLGPFTNENGLQYYIAVETHSNKPKGASVFIQA
jgi:hypothetical protein